MSCARARRRRFTHVAHASHAHTQFAVRSRPHAWFVDFFRTFVRSIENVLVSETPFVSVAAGLVGTIDLAYRDANGSVVLVDFKRCLLESSEDEAAARAAGRFGVLGATADLPDVRRSRWLVQLHYYAYLFLVNNPHLRVSELAVLRLHPSQTHSERLVFGLLPPLMSKLVRSRCALSRMETPRDDLVRVLAQLDVRVVRSFVVRVARRVRRCVV